MVSDDAANSGQGRSAREAASPEASLTLRGCTCKRSRIEVRVRTVVRGAEAASALDHFEAPGLHVGDLGVYVLYEVAKMVHALAMLVQELLVNVRASNRLHQLVEYRADVAQGELVDVGLLLAVDCHVPDPV